jgi:hypothetical protein
MSNPVSTVSIYRIEGAVKLSLHITVWFCWRNLIEEVQLEEIDLGGR